MLNVAMVGASKTFGEVQQKVRAYAPYPWPVLILGETGVGKELVARELHNQSPRAAKPFVVVNCGALPGQLFESELFGHERGAFSGASYSSKGLVRSAAGGTLFLDEIGDLDLPLQVKLLRLIENSEVRAVGSCRVEKVDVRILAATNVDLDEAIQRGKFRQDLKERLAVLTLPLPPLRARKEDIPLIAEHYLRQLQIAYLPNDLSPLQAWDWPGNIRQLKNILLRASVLPGRASFGEVLQRIIGEESRAWDRARARSLPDGDLWSGPLSEIEKKVIVRRLGVLGGNRTKAAEDLGIAKSTLHEKLKKWRGDAALGHS